MPTRRVLGVQDDDDRVGDLGVDGPQLSPDELQGRDCVGGYRETVSHSHALHNACEVHPLARGHSSGLSPHDGSAVEGPRAEDLIVADPGRTVRSIVGPEDGYEGRSTIIRAGTDFDQAPLGEPLSRLDFIIRCFSAHSSISRTDILVRDFLTVGPLRLRSSFVAL